jgi:hypothetical protein
VLSISNAVIPAKLLPLVCDTAAVRAQVQQRSAAGSEAVAMQAGTVAVGWAKLARKKIHFD